MPKWTNEQKCKEMYNVEQTTDENNKRTKEEGEEKKE